jgi:hypothetical protein
MPVLPETAAQQLQWRPIDQGGQEAVNSRASLYDPAKIGLANPLLSVVAEINVGADHHEAVIVRHEEPGHRDKDRYFIMGLDGLGEEATVNGRYAELIGINPIMVGRGDDAINLWQGLDADISREHASVVRTGEALLIRDHSTHGTFYRGFDAGTELNYVDQYTQTALRVADIQGHLTKGPDGESYMRGYRVVNRDTTDVEGTINIRSWRTGVEAMVTDSRKNPAQYDKFYDAFEERLNAGGRHQEATEELVLDAIARTTQAAMEYDSDFANNQTLEMLRAVDPTFREIGLDYYLANGKGVCRHMAGAAAWLAREAAERGLLNGQMFTRAALTASKDVFNGHEWARYVAADGTAYIIDPANQARPFAKLADLAHDKSSRIYFEEGERETYLARAGAGIAVAGTVEIEPHITPTDEILMHHEALKQSESWQRSGELGVRAARRLERDIDDLTAESVHVLSDEVLRLHDKQTSQRITRYIKRVADELEPFLIVVNTDDHELDSIQDEQRLFVSVVEQFNRIKVDMVPPSRQKAFLHFKKRFLSDTIGELAKRQL